MLPTEVPVTVQAGTIRVRDVLPVNRLDSSVAGAYSRPRRRIRAGIDRQQDHKVRQLWEHTDRPRTGRAAESLERRIWASKRLARVV